MSRWGATRASTSSSISRSSRGTGSSWRRACNLERYYLEVFDQKHPIAEYAFPTATVGVDLGAQYPRFGEVRLGLFTGVTKGKLESGRRGVSTE